MPTELQRNRYKDNTVNRKEADSLKQILNNVMKHLLIKVTYRIKMNEDHRKALTGKSIRKHNMLF